MNWSTLKNNLYILFLFLALFINACSGGKRSDNSTSSMGRSRKPSNASMRKADFKYKVKMHKQGGVYQVEAKINGTPLDFILDTGCSDVAISLTEAEYFLKNNILTKEDLGDLQYSRLANGGLIQTLSFNIRTMEFGGKKLYNVKASITNSSKAPLLLGQTVLSKLSSLNIDNSRSEIRFN